MYEPQPQANALTGGFQNEQAENALIEQMMSIERGVPYDPTAGFHTPRMGARGFSPGANAEGRQFDAGGLIERIAQALSAMKQGGSGPFTDAFQGDALGFPPPLHQGVPPLPPDQPGIEEMNVVPPQPPEESVATGAGAGDLAVANAPATKKKGEFSDFFRLLKKAKDGDEGTKKSISELAKQLDSNATGTIETS